MIRLDGKKLYLLMAKKGFSSQDLGDKAGFSRRTISRYIKSCKITTDKLHMLSRALECEPEDLIEFIEEDN